MDWFIVGLIAVVGIVVLVWAARAGGRRSNGLSDADRYQLDLARKSAAHTQDQTRRAAALRPDHPAQRTGYSQAGAYRSGPAQGQNETHGQNLRGTGSGPRNGQNAGTFAGQEPAASGQVNGALLLQLQGMLRGGQKMQAVNLLREQTHMTLSEARSFIDRLR
jgi:hypothetical protein